MVRPGLNQRLLVADVEWAVIAAFRVDLSLDAALPRQLAIFTGALPAL
jgi:hypothetical protein